jgi:hypothetical protein
MKLRSLVCGIVGASLAASAAATCFAEVAPSPGRATKPPAEVQPPRSIYDRALDDTIHKATDGWMEDPLKAIAGDMDHCTGELTAFRTNKPVQQREEQAISRLDAVIKQLEKECNGSKAGGSVNPTKPMNKSVIAGGPGGMSEMHDAKNGEKQWASLPPKQREQILQSKTQGFPPGFESILQSYYERLAQEDVGGDGSNSAEPTPAPKTAKPAAGGGK